jgi:hypothetical protein
MDYASGKIRYDPDSEEAKVAALPPPTNQFKMKSLPKSCAKQPIKKTSVTKSKKPSKPKATSSNSSNDPKAKICAGLLEFEMLGINAVTRLHAATFANYKHVKSTGFANAIKSLKDDGMIEYPTATTVSLTAKGRQETPPVNPPKSNADALLRLQEVIRMVSPTSGPKLNTICQFLSDGKEHSVDAVLKASGYKHVKSTGFANCLSSLSNLGFLVRGHGTVKLADLAFPYGR